MNSVISSSFLSKSWVIKHITSFRTAHWMKDYKPGPYPRTKREIRAAAEKYGIPYSEYKPYPDDGTGRGDYPELPLISADAKDPFYPWDYPELKRNFGETMHAEFDLIREDRYDISHRPRRPMKFMLLQTFGTFFACFVLYCMCEKVKMFPAATPKQYPNDGRKHFTFEPNGSPGSKKKCK